MNPLFSSALHAPLENFLNRLLERDPETARELGELAGKVIQIECRSPHAQLFVTIHADEIRLNAVYEGEVDAKISGSPAALGKLVLSSDKSSALYDPDITLSGDTELIQALYGLFASLDIDWQGDLATIVGDVATQHLSHFLDWGRQWLNDSSGLLINNIDEYLHEEAQLFPTLSEVRQFYEQVDDLKLDVDRLDARTHRLAERLAELDPRAREC